MAGSTVTIPVAQFAQQLKQKYPQYSSVADDKLVAAFLSKNPRYQANYEGTALVSVSFEPAAAAAPAQKPGVTASVPSPAAGTGTNAPNPPVVAPTTAHAAEATVVRPAAPTPTTSAAPSAAAAQPAPLPKAPSTEAPYLGNTVIVSAEAVSAPPMIGKYQVIDELGRGGMGVIYKAFDPGIGRTVALKLMSEQLARDAEFRERFLREARGVGILQHPNIVTIHELGEWQGAPFIAMEFLQGRSLEDILQQEKAATPLEKRLEIVTQVCRGLDYAHARGIVHRDIKPANVMVTTDGVAKVVDFGIARLADQKLTNTGHVLGTVSYMSPEQLQGKALDGRSDIFAVGVMLFEALTSVLPFAAEDTGSAITNTLYRQPPSLANFLANYPKGLDAVLAKCLAKDPAERFQTAGELADRLAQVRQEIQQSQAQPTVIRSTPLPSDESDLLKPTGASSSKPQAIAANLGAPSMGAAGTQLQQAWAGVLDAATGGNSTESAGRQLRQAAQQSKEFAKEWWKLASPRGRRNAITIGIPALLYLVALIAPSAMFSSTALGGGYVKATTIVLPVAILAGIVIGAQLWAERWRSSTATVKTFVIVVGFIVAAYCADNIALGLIWYIVDSWMLLILVAPLLLLFAGANFGLVREGYRAASHRERSLAKIGIVLLSLYFVLSFGFKLRSASGLMSGSTAKSYIDRNREYAQKETPSAAQNPTTTPKELKLELVRTLVGQPGSDGRSDYFLRSVSFSPDGNLIATADFRSIRLWDVASGTLLRTIDGAFGGAVFSPDGRWLVNGGEVWDVNTGRKVRNFSGDGHFAMSLEEPERYRMKGEAWHYIATTRYNIVSVWNMDTGALVREFDAQGGVQSLVFVPGQFGLPENYAAYALPVVLATGMEDGTVKLWNARTGKLMNTLSGHEKKVTAILYSQTSWSSNSVGGVNENLLTLDEGGTIRDWRFNQSKVEVTHIAQMSSLGGRTEVLYGAFAFIPNDTVIVGTGDGKVTFNSLSQGGASSSFLSAHTKAVNTVAISPNGAFLATGSDDKTVKIWKLSDSNGNPAGAMR